MSRRLILSIISNIIEQAIIAAAVLWALPLINVRIPLWGLILIMLAWGFYSIFTHRLGSRALKTEVPAGLGSMVGCRGVVVTALAPEGQVLIKGEIWKAESNSGNLGQGKQIIVVGQNRLKLVVKTFD